LVGGQEELALCESCIAAAGVRVIHPGPSDQGHPRLATGGMHVTIAACVALR
jgi:hypothetical protein